MSGTPARSASLSRAVAADSKSSRLAQAGGVDNHFREAGLAQAERGGASRLLRDLEERQGHRLHAAGAQRG